MAGDEFFHGTGRFGDATGRVGDAAKRHTAATGAARLAAALGWGAVPQLSAEQKRVADEKLAAAQAEARRVYGIDEAA